MNNPKIDPSISNTVRESVTKAIESDSEWIGRHMKPYYALSGLKWLGFIIFDGIKGLVGQSNKDKVTQRLQNHVWRGLDSLDTGPLTKAHGANPTLQRHTKHQIKTIVQAALHQLSSPTTTVTTNPMQEAIAKANSPFNQGLSQKGIPIILDTLFEVFKKNPQCLEEGIFRISLASGQARTHYQKLVASSDENKTETLNELLAAPHSGHPGHLVSQMILEFLRSCSRESDPLIDRPVPSDSLSPQVIRDMMDRLSPTKASTLRELTKFICDIQKMPTSESTKSTLSTTVFARTIAPATLDLVSIPATNMMNVTHDTISMLEYMIDHHNEIFGS